MLWPACTACACITSGSTPIPWSSRPTGTSRSSACSSKRHCVRRSRPAGTVRTPRSRSTSSTWAGCFTRVWSAAGPAGLRMGWRTHRLSATPRQVRAGVSPALDNLCDQVLGDPPRHHAEPIRSAGALVHALNKVLGPADASGDLERRLHPPAPAESSEPKAATAPAAEPPTIPAAHPTTKISTPVGPPPGPQRRPRRWIPLLAVLVVLLAIGGVLIGVVAGNRGGTGAAGDPTASQSATGKAAAGQAGAAITITGARDFDPQGDD